jgi:hypothetical protein
MFKLKLQTENMFSEKVGKGHSSDCVYPEIIINKHLWSHLPKS